MLALVRSDSESAREKIRMWGPDLNEERIDYGRLQNMTNLTMYRGIAVAPAKVPRVVRSIENGGLRGDEGGRRCTVPCVRKVRGRLADLFDESNATVHDIFKDTGDYPGVFACGSRIGAEYYAAHHNQSGENNQALVIEFITQLENTYVDARDFLCTAFQLWDRDSGDRRTLQAEWLRKLFGPKILRYFDPACETSDQNYRIFLCNLAAFDPSVVLAHHTNSNIIRGRWGTRFASAFIIQGPVPAAGITAVHQVHRERLRPADVSLTDFLGE